MRRAASIAWVMVLGLALALAACAPREPKPVPGQNTQERSQQLIDSGNQAFRAGNFGLAARRYAAAAVVKPDDPAAYYGMGMALSKLGRDEEARKAYAKARDLAQHTAPSPSAP
jgi:Flp pilus assembly protein TadD